MSNSNPSNNDEPEPEEKKQEEQKNNDDDEVKEEATKKITIEKVSKSILDKLSKDVSDLYQYKCPWKINNDGSVTFEPTPNLKIATNALPQTEINMKRVAKIGGCKQVESSSNQKTKVVQGDLSVNSFITSSLMAWSRHYPLKIKPEHIWLLIVQSVALHVDKNAEKLRKEYVMHEGKKELIVDRNNFVLGSPDNDWGGVIDEFAEQMEKNTVKDTVELLDCNFSSSTLEERLATKVTIMDICKNYFKYTVRTRCGFPSITLAGTKNDWLKLKEKCKLLLNKKVTKEFGGKWSLSLLPLIDRFIAAFDGDIDAVFWNSMIKRGGTSGSGAYKYYCGWFNILFPIIDEKENRYCEPYSIDKSYVEQAFVEYYNANWGDGHGGPDQSKYSSGLSTAPVKWEYLGQNLPLKFLAGFMGYKQDEKTLEICPNVGWCIAHLKKNKKK